MSVRCHRLQLLDVLEQTHSQNNGSNQDAGQAQLGPQSGGDASQASSAALSSAAAQAALDVQQPPLVPQPSNPAWSAAQQQTHQRQQSTSGQTPQMQPSGQTAQAWQKQPQQPPGPDGNAAAQQVAQNAPQSVPAQSSASAQGSPRKGQQQQPTPVWSGPIQWAMIDPISKMKRDLAFYVEARPVRASAVAELCVFPILFRKPICNEVQS